MINMLFRNLKNLLILSFFISGGCQLTQSNVSVKETVRNTQQEIKDESQPEELNESENADIDEINTKDEIFEVGVLSYSHSKKIQQRVSTLQPQTHPHHRGQ